ncbi:hypothetical protein BU26DRAFT_534434 [Trematosphaeria pertusa]|uniref:DUF6594 domain-containing protein n=1 Tax=Trematosphaeria pertusa TaxID=390896 RepID=A0A6A6HXW2_9PLEO|nr:uncharacterized protein BU26DRAFT_534434 [Trematosphaeria pertusa]KAF2242886.1 hypothetical protein BU26DRAFT_534434 [Trematosphaeria pertusa]
MNGSSTVEKGPPFRDGYPSLAAWIARDPDSESYVFRKFDRLSARNLLNLQSHLIELERRIEDWDDDARRSQNFDVRQSLRRWETFEELAKDAQRPEHARIQEKMKLEAELREKIREYHEALVLQSQISNLDRPSSRVLSTFRSFFSKPSTIVSGKAKHMLDDAEDLVALRPPADTDPLSRFLRDYWPFRGTVYPDPRDNTQHFLESHVKWVVLVISIVVAAILLIGAITSLYFVRRPGSKRQEVFAASAAYAAVLVVFVSRDIDKDGNG